MVQRGNPIIRKARGTCPENRHLLPRCAESTPVADELARDIAAGIFRAAALVLVDRHHVSKIQHVDFLKLGGGAIFRSHDIERDVDVRHDSGIALADPGSLDNDEIKARCLTCIDDID